MPFGYCKVPGCDKFAKEDLKPVYPLPKELKDVDKSSPTATARVERRRRWLLALNRNPNDYKDCENLVVCGKHFVKGKPAAVGNKFDVDWVPTLLLGSSNLCANPTGGMSLQRSHLLPDFSPGDLTSPSEESVLKPLNDTREEYTGAPPKKSGFSPGNPINCGTDEASEGDRFIMENAATSSENVDMSLKEPSNLGESSESKWLRQRNAELLTENAELRKKVENMSNEFKGEIERLSAENADLMLKIEEFEKINKEYQEGHSITDTILNDLKSKLEKLSLNEETFRGKNATTKYLTGLPNFGVLMTMFRHIEPHIQHSPQSLLTKLQKFILTLMRMRLNLEFVFLGYFFRVSEHTAARVFYSVLEVMYVRYEPLVFWPTRESLYDSMPMAFRDKFGKKVAIIIDCFEVFMERPSNPLASAQVYSQYKNHCTVKWLIGVSPQGAIIFISKGYGGRASDKHITETCGFLDKLCPGDIILADRGFTVHELVRMQRAELHMPAFKTRGQLQMDPAEVEYSRVISNLRIHVERVIGTLKNRYKIWASTIPMHFFHCEDGEVPLVGKMMLVCSALSNVNPTVVSVY